MFLHIGEEKSVYKTDIIGIFDLENTSTSKKTREFLVKNEKEGKIKNVSFFELPQSFILCKNGSVFLSPISSKVLFQRLKQ